MAWSDIADRALQKAIKAFQVLATYTPADGSQPYELNGVFSKPYQAIDPQTGALVSSSQFTFGVRLADMTAAPDEGDRLTLNLVQYQVVDAQGDGEGGSSLSLQKIG
jgi:hypothetical protein